MKKGFEKGRFLKFLKDMQLLVASQVGLIAVFFHTLLQPGPFFRILNVHELHANFPAIGLFEQVNNFTKGGFMFWEA